MNPNYAEIIARLRQLDYVADAEIATSLFLADQLAKPILIEGEAGVGKTEIARALAKLHNTDLVRLQCYEAPRHTSSYPPAKAPATAYRHEISAGL